MFKLVVLSAFLCAAVAEPGVFIAPTSYSATIPAPATTTYVQHSSAIYPAPVPSVYSALPYPHYIKKREAQFFNGYVAPSAYVAGAALATPYASTLVAPAGFAASYSPAVLPYAAPTHLIKKRSAELLAAPATYIAPTPFASTYVASAPLAATYSAPIVSSASYYPTFNAGLPFIKK